MRLHSQSYPDNYLEMSVTERKRCSRQTPVVIIPGLFGSTVNWRGFAKKLSSHHPVIVIDQRNHGRSEHTESNTYQDMVGDLSDFLLQNELTEIMLCGHSMGGKVAMLFALQYPEKIKKIAVLDIAPVTYMHSHAPFLDELLNVDLGQIQSRRDADRLLEPVIGDVGTRLFLLQNLAGTAGNFFWRINLKVLHQHMSEIAGFPEQAISQAKGGFPSIFITGKRSNYVKETDHKIIELLFDDVSYVAIEEAGHWLHAEQPDRVLEALINFY